MNALQTAKASIQTLTEMLRGTAAARSAFASQRTKRPAPRDTTIYIIGNMVQVRDADTGRVLGWRESRAEAEQLGRDLVAGRAPINPRASGGA